MCGFRTGGARPPEVWLPDGPSRPRRSGSAKEHHACRSPGEPQSQGAGLLSRAGRTFSVRRCCHGELRTCLRGRAPGISRPRATATAGPASGARIRCGCRPPRTAPAPRLGRRGVPRARSVPRAGAGNVPEAGRGTSVSHPRGCLRPWVRPGRTRTWAVTEVAVARRATDFVARVGTGGRRRWCRSPRGGARRPLSHASWTMQPISPIGLLGTTTEECGPRSGRRSLRGTAVRPHRRQWSHWPC